MTSSSRQREGCISVYTNQAKSNFLWSKNGYWTYSIFILEFPIPSLEIPNKLTMVTEIATGPVVSTYSTCQVWWIICVLVKASFAAKGWKTLLESNVECCLWLLKYVAVKLQVRLSNVGVMLRDTELKLVFVCCYSINDTAAEIDVISLWNLFTWIDEIIRVIYNIINGRLFSLHLLNKKSFGLGKMLRLHKF